MISETEIILPVKDYGLDDNKTALMLTAFNDFYAQAAAFESSARDIVVTSAEQTDMMKEARTTRIAVRDIRIEVEKRRKSMKEQSLREGKAIDGIANIIKAIIVPIEDHLLAQEEYIERQQQAEMDRIAEERASRLTPYADPTM